MSGEATPAQIGGFLMALRVRGEAVERDHRRASRRCARGWCGSRRRSERRRHRRHRRRRLGHATTSRPAPPSSRRAPGPGRQARQPGAVLEVGRRRRLTALGVNIEVPPRAITRCIAEAGLGFMFAPAHHSAMRHVGPSRVELGTRTIFNLLGPLSNPAGVKRQVIGVFARSWIEPMAEVLGNLGSERVVGGRMAKAVSTRSPPPARPGLRNSVKVPCEPSRSTPEIAGVKRHKAADLKGGDAVHNAAVLGTVLDGRPVLLPMRR